MATLASLISTQSVSQIFATLLAQYQAAGFPVTAWQPGGVERTRLMAIATGLASFSNYIPAIAGGSLLDYAPNYPGWTALTAQEVYNLTQNAATFTQGNIVATNATSTPYGFSAGQLIAVFGVTGNRYFNVNAGTVGASGNTTILFQAEFAGASYADPSNAGSAGLTLVTPLPGVTLNNPSTSYTSVSHVGAGTGTLVLGGSPTSAHTVVLTITSTGQAGVAGWSYVLDGAAAVAGTSATLTNIGGTGINITLTNGASNPSFILNDTYTFYTPSPWITQQGANTETDTALAARCRARWSTLGNVSVPNLYYLLATSTPSVGAQVTQCVVFPDSTIPNKVNILIAGPGGALPGSVVSAVQAYISARAGQGDLPVVQTPTGQGITITGTYNVLVGQATAATSAIQTAINNYVASVPINGTVQLSEIITLIRSTSGVVNVSVSTVQINGASQDYNLAASGAGTYVIANYPPTINLTQVTQ